MVENKKKHTIAWNVLVLTSVPPEATQTTRYQIACTGTTRYKDTHWYSLYLGSYLPLGHIC